MLVDIFEFIIVAFIGLFILWSWVTPWEKFNARLVQFETWLMEKGGA